MSVVYGNLLKEDVRSAIVESYIDIINRSFNVQVMLNDIMNESYNEMIRYNNLCLSEYATFNRLFESAIDEDEMAIISEGYSILQEKLSINTVIENIKKIIKRIIGAISGLIKKIGEFINKIKNKFRKKTSMKNAIDKTNKMNISSVKVSDNKDKFMSDCKSVAVIDKTDINKAKAESMKQTEQEFKSFEKKSQEFERKMTESKRKIDAAKKEMDKMEKSFNDAKNDSNVKDYSNIEKRIANAQRELDKSKKEAQDKFDNFFGNSNSFYKSSLSFSYMDSSEKVSKEDMLEMLKTNIKNEFEKIKEEYGGPRGYVKFSKKLINNFRGITPTVQKNWLSPEGNELLYYERALIKDWRMEYYADWEKRYEEEQAAHDKTLEKFESMLYNIVSKPEIYFDCWNYIDKSGFDRLLNISIDEDLSNIDSLKGSGIMKKNLFNKCYRGYDDWWDSYNDIANNTSYKDWNASYNGDKNDLAMIEDTIKKNLRFSYNNKTLKECLECINNIAESDQLDTLSRALNKYKELNEKIQKNIDRLSSNKNNAYSYSDAVDISNLIKKYSGFLNYTNANIAILTILSKYAVTSVSLAKSACSSIDKLILDMNSVGYTNTNSVKARTDFGYKVPEPPAKYSQF